MVSTILSPQRFSVGCVLATMNFVVGLESMSLESAPLGLGVEVMRKSLVLPAVVVSSFAAGAVFVQLGSHFRWWPAADSVPTQPSLETQLTDTDVAAQAEEPNDLIDQFDDYETDDYPPEVEPETDSPLQSGPEVVLVPDQDTVVVESQERISSPIDIDVPAHDRSQPDQFRDGGAELIAYPGYYDEYYPEYESRNSSVYFSYFDFPYAIYTLHYRHRPFYRSYGYPYSYSYNHSYNNSYNYPYYDSYYRYGHRDFFYIPTRYKRDYKHRDSKHRRHRDHHRKNRLHNRDGRLRDHRYATSDKYKKRLGRRHSSDSHSSDSRVARHIARDSLRHRSLISGDRTTEKRPLRQSVTITPVQDEIAADQTRRKLFYSNNRQRKSFLQDRERHLSKSVRADRKVLARSRSSSSGRNGRVAIPERKQPERNVLDTVRQQTQTATTIAPANLSRALNRNRSASPSRALNYRSRILQQQRANTAAQRVRARHDATARRDNRAQKPVSQPVVRQRASAENRVKRQVRQKRQIRQSRSRIRSSHNRIRNRIKR